MDTFWEVLKIILPAVLVLIAVYYVLKQFFANEAKKRQLEVRKENANLVTPVRLQAYERLVLFMERINPESLILRVHKDGLSAKEFHVRLLKTIRDEYEHNITQQMYVSNGAWNMVTNAKNNIVKLCNIALHDGEPTDSSLQMSRRMVDAVEKADGLPTNTAISYLKDEVKRLF